jgi:hypothetical protein
MNWGDALTLGATIPRRMLIIQDACLALAVAITVVEGFKLLALVFAVP